MFSFALALSTLLSRHEALARCLTDPTFYWAAISEAKDSALIVVLVVGARTDP